MLLRASEFQLEIGKLSWSKVEPTNWWRFFIFKRIFLSEKKNLNNWWLMDEWNIFDWAPLFCSAGRGRDGVECLMSFPEPSVTRSSSWTCKGWRNPGNRRRTYWGTNPQLPNCSLGSEPGWTRVSGANGSLNSRFEIDSDGLGSVWRSWDGSEQEQLLIIKERKLLDHVKII